MKLLKDERGSALILAILMIGLLAVIGISSTQTTTVETRIAGNERLHKTAFYEADGGAELAIELLEQNIEERGFGESCVGPTCTYGDVGIETAGIGFYMNTLASVGTAAPCDPCAACACADCPPCAAPGRDAFYPSTATCAANPCSCTTNEQCTPVTSFKIGGDTELSTGGAIQMIAGYEGKGKGAAGGGSWIVYTVRSHHQGPNRSDSVVETLWRYVM